jgi:hypothetical protein
VKDDADCPSVGADGSDVRSDGSGIRGCEMSVVHNHGADTSRPRRSPIVSSPPDDIVWDLWNSKMRTKSP